MRISFGQTTKSNFYSKADQLYEGIDWESVKEKYEKILQLFIQSIPDANKYPHKKDFFTRERIASKIKCIRVKYRKALDTGRQSGGGRVVATFYDRCSEIWSGSPATGSMEQSFKVAILQRPPGKIIPT